MEKSSIIHYLKKENQNFSKEANGDITLYDKEFGGYTFNWITMGFHNNMFCFISFSKNFRTKQTAESAFDDLKNSLMKKYYLLKTENDIWLFSDGRTSVFLSMTFSESKGGDLFYYVDLSYGDDKLMDLHLKKSEEDF